MALSRIKDPIDPSIPKEQIDRFWPKVNFAENGCWLWNRSLTTNGYGKFTIKKPLQVAAHCFSYQAFKGPIPEGLDIDHLCRNRACVNPDHLEAVTRKENLLRGNTPMGIVARTGRCLRGHERVEGNLYWHNNKSFCRMCLRIGWNKRERIRRQRKKAGASC